MRAGVYFVLAAAGAAFGQNCANTSTGRVPINDLGTGLYLGQFQGGLYPGGSNVMPAAHWVEGLARAAAVQPRNAAGQPDVGGRIVMVSIGMSNTTQEYCSQGSGEPCDAWTFTGRAVRREDVDRRHLVIVNGAAGGQAAGSWDSPIDPNYTRVRDQVLAPRGLTEAQVQVAWVKVANAQPAVALPTPSADAYQLEIQTGNIVRAMKVRYPNLQMVFLSSRIYAGYATTALNPEPYAYESAFGAKWVIEAQINQMAPNGMPDPQAGNLNYSGPTAVAPWIAWGPYLWADGMTPRSDGLIWRCSDLVQDGTHPSPGVDGGRAKVGLLLERFFFGEGTPNPLAAPWLLGDPGVTCYANCDGSTTQPVLNVADFTCFLQAFAGLRTYANCDGSTAAPLLNVADFTCFLQRFAAGCQ